MIRSRWLSRAEWEKKLRRLGARPLEGKGPLNTAEWWKRPDGLPFTVPIEKPDDQIDFWAFQRICALLEIPPSVATTSTPPPPDVADPNAEAAEAPRGEADSEDS
jgi:hypothetical protein